MADVTTYAVNLKYTVDAAGGQKGTQALSQDVRELGRQTRRAEGAFMDLGRRAVELGGRAFEFLSTKLVGFNRDVQNAKIGLEAMVQGNLGGDWDNATASADRLYESFKNFSVETPVTTAEITAFGQATAVATFQAGGAINDLTTIAEKGVIAAKSFGYQTAYTSLELSEMLSGNVNNRMMFAKQLLGMAHVSEEEFKKMSAQKRLDLVEKVLNSDAMKNAQREFGASWTGVTSTLEDKIQLIFGAMGQPLFKALTAEVAKWNDWLSKNSYEVDKIAHTLGEGLAKGFGVVKDAVSFLVSHSDALLAIGKVWLAIKVGGAIGSGFVEGGAGGASRWSKLAAWQREGRDSFDPATGGYKYQPGGAGASAVTMGNIAGNLPILAQSLAVGMAIGSLINSFTGLDGYVKRNYVGLDATTRRFEELELQSKSLGDAMERAAAAAPNSAVAVTNIAGLAQNYTAMANLAADAARAASGMTDDGNGNLNESAASTYRDKMAALQSMGIGQDDLGKGGLQGFADAMSAKAQALADRQAVLTATGTDAWEFGFSSLTDYQQRSLNVQKAQQDLLAYINSHGLTIDPKTILDIMRGDTDDPTGKRKPMADKPNVNVHIARIEVQSDDPDRMAFGLVEFFRDAAKNPSSAVSALREG